jgi:hypothetical protein
MNRANQAALFQQTNQGLLNIRQLELNYYINLNIAFGTQAALIGGFSYGLLTQTDFSFGEDVSYARVFQKINWVTSACTIAAAVHVIITTMMMQVLGPGLALHGPIGSMARAAQGMRVEQKPIIVAFVLMMVLFSVSTVLSFFSIMCFESSIAASGCFLVAARYWWYYSERIYLRFYWELSEEDDRYGNAHPEDECDEMDPAEPQLPVHLREASRTTSFASRRGRDTSKESNKSGHGSRHKPTMFQGLFSKRKVSNERKKANGMAQKTDHTSYVARLRSKDYGKLDEEENYLTERLLPNGSQHSHPPPLHNIHHDSHHDVHHDKAIHEHVHTPPIVTSAASICMEGYLSKKIGHHKHGLLDFHHKDWERRYFVLHLNGHLLYYFSRQAFRDHPKVAIHRRPMNLCDFIVEVFNSRFNERTISTVGDVHERSHMSEADVLSALGEMADDKTSHNVFSAFTHHGTNKQVEHHFQITLTVKDGVEIAPDTLSTVMDDSGRHSIHEDHNNVHSVGNAREPISLRCDTEEELEMWIQTMRQISPSSFLM